MEMMPFANVRERCWIALGFTRLFSAIVGLAIAQPTPVYAQAVEMTSEADLIGVLASGSDRGEMAIACKRLAVFGSEACVAEAAKLLGDAELASWARITLEAIPGEAANQALRDAASKLDGLLLVGVINSLGVRRDSAAVDLLTDKVKSEEREIVEAAALALGRIGTQEAAKALIDFLESAPKTLRSVAAEACNLCADRLYSGGNIDLSLKLYDKVRESDVPTQRIVEATRGAILARKEDGIQLLKEQLRSKNQKLFELGLQTAREISSDQLGPVLLEEIASASPERAALIVEILGDLSGKADLTSLLSLAEKGSRDVRLAAISVLGRVGDRSCIEPLLGIAMQSGDLRAAVRASLVNIQGADVDQEILQRLPSATDHKILLLELIGLRQIQATDELIKSLKSSDAGVRAAALQSLGETVPQNRLDVLVSQVLSPKSAEDAEPAARALRTAAVRMPDRDACANLLGEAMKNATTANKTALLETIAAVAGPRSLQILADYAKKGDESLRDISTRLLGEWMTVDVAPVLLDLASNGPADRFQVRAMRGYIRVCRQFVLPEEDRVKMCAEALKAAKNVAEQKLVLEVLQRYPSLGTLRIAINAIEKAPIQNEARNVAKAIGQKMADNADAQKLLKDAGL